MAVAQFDHGGWFPLAIAAFVFAISSIWYWGQTKKARFLKGDLVPLSEILEYKEPPRDLS